MATKTDFTPAEWQTLKWAVTDTMMFLSMADPGFWDMFKEANAAAHYMAAAKQTSASALVRELAADIKTKRDKEVSGNPTDVSGEVIDRVNEAVKIVSGKAPEDLEAFKAFIIGVAKATAEAANGTGPTEAQAIAKLEAALG
jgi:translation initiation factor 2B subunit (eIF-2B alpha/beta/delta family)